MAALVLVVSLFKEPGFVKEVSRTAAAVADVAEGTGALASSAAHAAANATVAVTTTAASLASSSLSLAKEAWIGVDLLNVTVNRSHGRIIASNMSEVGMWIRENPALHLYQWTQT